MRRLDFPGSHSAGCLARQWVRTLVYLDILFYEPLVAGSHCAGAHVSVIGSIWKNSTCSTPSGVLQLRAARRYTLRSAVGFVLGDLAFRFGTDSFGLLKC